MKHKFTAQQIERIREIVLDKWVAANSGESLARLMQLLAQVESSLELHQIAANLSWDTGFNVLEKVITHPLCEKGTALMIYFLGKPHWYYQHLQKGKPLIGDQPQSFAFLQRIEQSVMNQQFCIGVIGFDPTKVRGNFDSSMKEGAELVPSFMKCLIQGEDVEILVI
jgi:hypothetical protein